MPEANQASQCRRRIRRPGEPVQPGAPVIEVSGRTYPVEVRYRPLAGEADPGDEATRTEEPRDQVQGICDAVAELSADGPGDILVFLSGEREIRDTADALADREDPAAWRCFRCTRRLSAAEQHRVFQPHGPVRRVVLATNVAETSLTVPGIKYVVDPGTARISRYSQRTKVQRLPIEPISQASANQRKGRCGRTSDGVCIRLYSEEDFAAAPGVHRPGDPAHQPGLGHPADGRAGPGRRGRLPVRRPAGVTATSRTASGCWRNSAPASPGREPTGRRGPG